MAASGVSRIRANDTFEIRIVLLEAHVRIDRTVLVRAGVTLGKLHRIIQGAMGWEDYHLHEFTDEDGITYGDDDTIDPTLPDMAHDIDDSQVRVMDVLARPGDTLRYVYDFGDDWQHLIRLIAVHEGRGARVGTATCIDGHGACPREDCGGTWGYSRICAAEGDPDAVRGTVMPLWGLDWDPHAFDLDGTNRRLRSMLRPRSFRTRPNDTLEIDITLLDVGIKVERRVFVRAGALLGKLHLAIQAVMGWEDRHPHAFRSFDGTPIGRAHSIDPRALRAHRADDESHLRAMDLLNQAGDALLYVYGARDDWQHSVRLIEVHQGRWRRLGAVSCTRGRGACPPEDCGGPSRYREVCEAIAGPGAAGITDLPKWAENWDPEAFGPDDVDVANRRLRASLRRAARRGS